jgi:DHA2 family multidrug resistance protein
MSPSGVSSLMAMVLAGFLLSRQFDARWLMAAGLIAMAIANNWMAHTNLEISPSHVIGPRMLLTLGLGLLFAPASVAAYKYIPPHLRAAGVGLLSLLRTEGGSVGTSMAHTIQERREQFHLSRMGEGLGLLNHHAESFLHQTRDFVMQSSGDAIRSQQVSLHALDSLRQQQSAAMGFLDVFWLCGVLTAILVALVLLMKRSVAEPGEHISAE